MHINTLIINFDELVKQFPIIYSYYFGWRQSLFDVSISVILIIWGYTNGHGLGNLIAMLSSSKTVPFGLLVI